MSFQIEFVDFPDEEVRGYRDLSETEDGAILTTIKREVCDSPDLYNDRVRPQESFSEENSQDSCEAARNLFLGWGLRQEAIDRLIFCGIKFEMHLRLMHNHHIEDIFKKDELIGDKILFTNKLQEWKMRKMCPPLRCCSMASSSSDSVSPEKIDEPSPISPIPFNRPEVPVSRGYGNFNLGRILRRTAKGQQILSNYSKNGYLASKEQSYLAHIIIDDHMMSKKKMSQNLFEHYASEIVRLFPTETIETYYMPRQVSAKKNSAGKLYDRYRNMSYKTKYYKNIGATSREVMNTANDTQARAFRGAMTHQDTAIKEEFPGGKLSYSPSEDEKLSKEWLKNNTNHWERILIEWRKTTKFRYMERKSYAEDIPMFINEWPRYKDITGYQLVEIDFDFRHPGMKFDLINNFQKLHDVMKPIFIQEAKDKLNQAFFEDYFANDIGFDTKDFLLTVLLHCLIPPARHSSGKKPSISEAQNDFVMCFETVGKLQEGISQLQKEPLALHPRIFVIGSNCRNISQFYIFFSGILYKLPTFVKCIDLAVKICIVFNIDFSETSKLVWSFLYNLFFKLDNKYIPPKVLNLINKVKNGMR